MKKIILLIVITTLYAEDLPSKEELLKLNSSEKMKLYELNKQSPITNVLLSTIAPSLGHYRAKNWKRGGKVIYEGARKTAGYMVIVALAAGLSDDEIECRDGRSLYFSWRFRYYLYLASSRCRQGNKII